MAKAPTYKPWLPPEWEVADAVALQALQRGDADSHAQKRALDWIVKQACRTYDLPYFADSERDSTFATGKQFVGQQIVKLLHINTMKMKKEN